VTLVLNAPASLTVPASNATGSFTVTWSGSNVTGSTYILEQSFNGGAFTQISSGLSTSATVAVSVVGSYTYRVKATKAGYAESGYTNGSNPCVVSSVLPQCGAPSYLNVPVTNTTGTLSINWGGSNVTGVTYMLEVSTDGGGNWTAAYTGINRSVNLPISSDGIYTFRVKATKAGYNDSSWRNGSNDCQVTLTCGTPSSLSVPLTNTSGSYSVTWGSSNITGVTYVLEVSNNGGGSWGTAYSGPNRSINITGATSGSYLYRVKAIKSGYADSNWRSAGPCVVTR
jgi:hypothetical protein